MPLQDERYVLHIPREMLTQPIIYRLVKDFDVAVNVMKAGVIDNDEGLMVLGMQGTKQGLADAIRYLKDQGVRVQALKRDVTLKAEKCTHCGACIGQCPTAALTMTDTFEVKFDPEKCIACGHCAWACSFDAVEVMFEG